MSTANLSNADLSGVNLSDAILDAVDLRGATYTEAQLAQAHSAQIFFDKRQIQIPVTWRQP
ncbi:MAG TPA: pentapeptide repeat-containing protein [Ktedonosporobacter sp.]|nr:pentapeptide repeat-containing protein [Ktedonosporobacter sp.]